MLVIRRVFPLVIGREATGSSRNAQKIVVQNLPPDKVTIVTCQRRPLRCRPLSSRAVLGTMAIGLFLAGFLLCFALVSLKENEPRAARRAILPGLLLPLPFLLIGAAGLFLQMDDFFYGRESAPADTPTWLNPAGE